MQFIPTDDYRISIHAPAKGATKHWIGILISRKYFNPRSREGSDSCRLRARFPCVYFNPRSREGSDVLFGFHSFHLWISIHAPAKGATKKFLSRPKCLKFQSTLPRRERLPPSFLQSLQRNFNPRSREGSDQTKPALLPDRRNFNPRSREGSDDQLIYVNQPSSVMVM